MAVLGCTICQHKKCDGTNRPLSRVCLTKQLNETIDKANLLCSKTITSINPEDARTANELRSVLNSPYFPSTIATDAKAFAKAFKGERTEVSAKNLIEATDKIDDTVKKLNEKFPPGYSKTAKTIGAGLLTVAACGVYTQLATIGSTISGMLATPVAYGGAVAYAGTVATGVLGAIGTTTLVVPVGIAAVGVALYKGYQACVTKPKQD